MFCDNCGYKLDTEDQFCPDCGDKVDDWGRGNKLSTKKVKLILLVIVLLLIGAGAVYYLSNRSVANNVNNQVTTNTNDNIINNINTDITNEFPTSRISASVVSIYCPLLDDEENGYWGSGTIFTEDGIVITNSHVIPQNETELLIPEYGCMVTLPDPDTGIPIEMYYADPIVIPGLSDEYDLAILEIYDVYIDEDGYSYGTYPKTFPAFDDTDLCTEEYIRLGEPVIIFGYPASSGNDSLTVTEGVVSNFPDDINTILTSAKIDAGNSGGLAVDRDGCQLGVPSAVSIGQYENLGVIITTEAVFEFIDKYIEILEE